MLTQDMLNVVNRNEAYLDILMFVPDKNIRITNVAANSTLSFSNLSSVINIDSYSSDTMATLERNLLLLNGAFFNPNKGQVYNGYISNDMSDDNGDFETNPEVTLTLLQGYTAEYFSIVFNPSIPSAYPKQVIAKFLSSSGATLKELTIDISEVDTMPNLILDVHQDNVQSVKLEFVGTQAPHRRIRLSTAMFGKLEIFGQDDIVNSDWMDKNSLVADSLPSRVFSFSMINYDKKYNIDNPSNKLPVMDKSTEVIMRWGYKSDEGLIEWTPMKHLRLLSVSTSDEDTVEFESGSILDMMDEIFDEDVYTGPRTVSTVVNTLLNFVGVDTNTIVYDGDYANAIIDRPLPESPVRELIQLCAFACGATLQIMDDGTIKFANLDMNKPTIKAKYTYDNFVSVPRAEQLDYTANVALTRTSSVIDSEVKQVSSSTVDTFQVTIDYSPTYGPYAECNGGTITNAKYYTSHCDLELNFTGDTCEVTVYGQSITTTTRNEKSATADTLILDSQLAKDPSDAVKQKYSEWYNKRFKYVMTTRGEPLTNASDFIQMQTPFSNKVGTEVTDPITGYVLQNHITYDGAWDGDMEVVAI